MNKVEEFEKIILSKIENGELTHASIFTHDYPDPDAIGAALGIQWLLNKHFGIPSTIYYGGEISHKQNQTLINILNVQMKTKDEYKSPGFTIYVDCKPGRESDNIKKCNICIDHHKGNDSDCEFIQNDSVGSCCTIISEYIKHFDLKFDDDIDENVATALFFGIYSDTNELMSESVTDRDFIACQDLSPHIERSKLCKIVEYTIPEYVFESERIISQSGNYIAQNLFFAGFAGVISKMKRDVLPMLADKMVRRENIETSIVFALIDDHLESSVRSRNPSVEVSSLCHKLFGKVYSGGKYGAGGAKVPIGIFSSEDYRDEVAVLLKNIVFKKIQEVAEGN